MKAGGTSSADPSIGSGQSQKCTRRSRRRGEKPFSSHADALLAPQHTAAVAAAGGIATESSSFDPGSGAASEAIRAAAMAAAAAALA